MRGLFILVGGCFCAGLASVFGLAVCSVFLLHLLLLVVCLVFCCYLGLLIWVVYAGIRFVRCGCVAGCCFCYGLGCCIVFIVGLQLFSCI